MGADCAAAWLGMLLVSCLSFAPAHMAPNERTRVIAGRVARLSLPASLVAAVWTTLSSLDLTPPPGGVFMWALYPLLLAALGLAAWGAGLIAAAAVRYWLGWRVPQIAPLMLGAGSVLLMVAVR